MSWGNPWMLWALTVPLLAGWWLRRMQHGRRVPWPAIQRVCISGGGRLRPAAPLKTVQAWSLLGAIALGILALARPQWGEHLEESFSQSREVMIALDLSRSMWTEDMPGETSRLDAAKDLLSRMLDHLKGENVGLIVFAGTAFVQVPMSPDDQIIRDFIPSLDPNYMPKGGSDYNRMLDSALEGFGEAHDRDRYLFVLSDGESSTQGWEQKLPQLLKRDIHVLGIGLGTLKGGFIPDPKGGYLADSHNDAVVSKLVPANLQTLANRTNGSYLPSTALSTEGALRQLVKDTVKSGRAGRVDSSAESLGSDRFQWLLAPAVLLGLLSLVREFSRRPRPRQIRREDRPGPPEAARRKAVTSAPRPLSAAAALVCVLGVGAALRVDAHFDNNAGFEVKEVFDSNPAERLRAIAAHLGALGYDAFDLELFVQASIKYGADQRRLGNPPLKGVIHDGLQAVQAGKRLNPKLGPWDYYQAQLQGLLAPLPAQAVDQKSQNPHEANDEDDNGPMIIGQNTQRGGSDSYGEGASSRSDITLGDLSAEDNFTPQQPHGRKPAPPKHIQDASVRQGEKDNNGPQDPLLVFSRKTMSSVVKADSPGRLHWLMSADDSKALKNVEQDW